MNTFFKKKYLQTQFVKSLNMVCHLDDQFILEKFLNLFCLRGLDTIGVFSRFLTRATNCVISDCFLAL